MRYQVLSVIYEIHAHRHGPGHFSVPKAVCKLLKLEPEHDIRLVVQTPQGTILYSGVKTLKSGREIYGEELRPLIKEGQRIRVVASRPDA